MNKAEWPWLAKYVPRSLLDDAEAKVSRVLRTGETEWRVTDEDGETYVVTLAITKEGKRGTCTCPAFQQAWDDAEGNTVPPCTHLVYVAQHCLDLPIGQSIGKGKTRKTRTGQKQAREQKEGSDQKVKKTTKQGAIVEEESAVVAEPVQAARPMIVSPAIALPDFIAHLKSLEQFIKQALVPGVDYGQIPGTQRPVLLKPGAEKLALRFGFVKQARLVEKIEDWETPFFYYRYHVELYLQSKEGERYLVAEADGSANSKESKWAYRWVPKAQVPEGLDPETLPKRMSGKTVLYQIPNPEIFSLVDTIQKMAYKRAFVAAVRLATATSGVFAEETEEEV